MVRRHPLKQVADEGGDPKSRYDHREHAVSIGRGFALRSLAAHQP